MLLELHGYESYNYSGEHLKHCNICQLESAYLQDL